MTTALTLLLWSVALYAVYLFTQIGLAHSAYGLDHLFQPRDVAPPPNLRAERAKRALANFLETFPVLIALLVVAHFAAPGDGVVFWAGLVWFAARLVYLPLYIFGIVVVRSLVWIVSLLALIAIFLGILF